MAIDDERSAEELRQQVDQLTKELEQLKKSLKKSGLSVDEFVKDGLKPATDSLQELTKGGKGLATSLAQGDRGFRVLDSAVDLTAGAFKGLLGFIPGVKGFTNAVAGASKVLIGEMEKQVKGFQTLGEVGALTEEGVEGFQKSVLKSGLTLDDYTQRIASSSKTLARFQGLTGTGAETFAKITHQLTQTTDVSLRRLGLSAEQMGESTEAFLTRQTRLGLSQGMTATQLAASTTSYIKELDLLSKVTGQSRKSIQDQQDAALSETRFRASMEGLRGTAEEGSINKMMNFQSTISDMDADLGAGVRDLASGFTATEAARRAEFVTGGRASQIMDRLRQGQIGELEARQQMQQAVIDNREQLIFAGRALGDTASIVGNTAGLFDFMNATIDENGKFVKQATDAQKGQVGGANALTNDLVKTQQTLERTQIEMQRLFFKAMPAAAAATNYFTKGMLSALISANNFLAEKFGVGETIDDPNKPKQTGPDYSELTKELKKLTLKFDRTDADDKRVKELTKIIQNERDRIKEERANPGLKEKDQKVNEILKNIENNTKEPVGNLSTIQSTGDAYKNLIAAGIKPEPANVKMAQLSGVHDAGKLASANDSDLVSSVLGLDAVKQFGAHRIGDLKNTLANLDLAGPKEQYMSKVADITPTIDDNTVTEAVMAANKTATEDSKIVVAAIEENNEILKAMYSAVTKGNNISRYNGRAGLA